MCYIFCTIQACQSSHLTLQLILAILIYYADERRSELGILCQLPRHLQYHSVDWVYFSKGLPEI